MYVRELEVRYKELTEKLVQISSPQAVYDVMKEDVKGLAQEKFWVLGVNYKNQIHLKQLISAGTVNESIIHPREVFKGMVVANASAIILVHNHPSGVLDPSDDDITVSKRLIDAGVLMGIPVLDHVIVSDTGFLSCKEDGYL